jgi:hypothetical protein
MLVRGTFESEQFVRQKEALGISPRRFDDLLFAITWVLGHDAEQFPRVPGTALLRIKTAEGAHGLPALAIYAMVDDHDNFVLQWLEPTEPDDLSDDDIPS